MPKKLFFVRVEIHDHQAGDYEKLHKEMLRFGLHKQLMEDGRFVDLPSGTYVKLSDGGTLDETNDEARRAASTLQKSFDLLTIETADLRFTRYNFGSLNLSDITNARPNE